MAWLSDWIKELILIILLAAFTDLLLPSQALQRYVRTVIGLFLLLVLLSPLYELFHHRWNPEQWMQAASGEQTAGAGQMQSLSAIVEQSNKVKAANQMQAKQILEQQLALAMKEGIESEGNAKVGQLRVSTRMDKQGKPVIEQVRVVLADATEAVEANAEPHPIPDGTYEPKPSNEPLVAAMEPIEPVVIDLDTKARAADAKGNDTVEAAGPSTPLQAQVQRYIAKEWQLKPSQVQVK